MKITKLLFLTILLCISYGSTAQTDNNDRGYRVNVGDVAPDVSLTMLEGDQISLKELRGSVVVLQFTASWCSVCRKEMPHLESDVWLPNQDKDFVLIAVDIDEEESKVAPFIEDMQITYPVALDANKALFHKFAKKGAGVTRNVVIDKDGKIVFLTRLYNIREFEEMKSTIEALLK